MVPLSISEKPRITHHKELSENTLYTYDERHHCIKGVLRALSLNCWLDFNIF